MRALIAVAVVASGCSFEPGRLGSTDGDGDGAVGDGGAMSADTITPDWMYRRDLMIDNTGLAAHTDLTVAIKLDVTRIRYSTTGADLRFTDAAGSPIPHEIEAWTPAGTSFVWVRVPSIAADAMTTIRMYYGNPNATDAQNAAGTWDSSYIGVWHLDDATDSTGTNASSNHGASARAGQLGPALDFNGSGDYVDTANTAQLAAWTIEAWVNPDTAATVTGAASVLSRYPNYMLLWSCNSATFCKKVMFDGAAVGTHNAAFDATVGSWSYVVGRYNGSVLSGWSNGMSTGTENTNDTADATTVTAKIGTRQDLLGDFDGGIDEVRISALARSDDYVRAQYRSMTDSYVSFGPEQTN